ncbi:MAG: hypothetical protein ACJA0C_000824 [Candidatus Endobugula sp.]|jgi:hypothetical protein
MLDKIEMVHSLLGSLPENIWGSGEQPIKTQV